ncbi:MAG: efflux RND transporter periplasmic adaptor subunit [Pseudomonadota bacterium]
MKAGRIISTLVGLLFLGSALAFGFWPDNRKAVSAPSADTVVRVANVKESVIDRKVTLSGITRAARRAVLAFSLPARMVQRPVDVGEHVAAGDLLAVLDVRQFDNAVAAARAQKTEIAVQLAQAERDRNRFAILKKDNVVPVKDYERVAATADGLAAGLQAAEAGLQEALRARAEAELRAPFAGTITAVHREPGEWAVPGQPVVEISGDGAVELEVGVPETIIWQLAEGQPVDVILPFAEGRHLAGRIDAVARAALSSGHLFPMVVSVDEPSAVIPGMTAEVILTVSTKPRLLVPVDAVVNPGASRPSVFVVTDGRAREVTVALGVFAGDDVSVTGDLVAGDRVVVAGQTLLADGKPVVVKQ